MPKPLRAKFPGIYGFREVVNRDGSSREGKNYYGAKYIKTWAPLQKGQIRSSNRRRNEIGETAQRVYGRHWMHKAKARPPSLPPFVFGFYGLESVHAEVPKGAVVNFKTDCSKRCWMLTWRRLIYDLAIFSLRSDGFGVIIRWNVMNSDGISPEGTGARAILGLR